MTRPSQKWQQMKQVYLCFKPKDCVLDFSKEAEVEMYLYESKGGVVPDTNGYYWCKHNLDLTLAMWVEDIQSGMLSKHELLESDGDRFPTDWLKGWLDTIYIPSYNRIQVLKDIKAYK
jgi:hypothetical protein